MPEGDVLRLTAARLHEALAGAVLVRGELRWPGLGGTDLAGARVLEVTAYGKHLLVRLSEGLTLHTHLRMEGSWRIERTRTPAARLTSSTVRAVLATDRWTAVGDRLGMLDLLRTRDEHVVLGHLGPDVLADELDEPGIVRRLRSAPEVPVAEALLDQTKVAGVGTLFSAEGLFARRIWPWTPVGDLGDAELGALLRTVRAQMQRSVRGGIRARVVRVHARAGSGCGRCGTPIRVGSARTPPNERPIYYCPACQRSARHGG
ncbi:MAG: DNA-formamidopyrimidine glycosylase family protein [Cellulomonadaceae bacterium]